MSVFQLRGAAATLLTAALASGALASAAAADASTPGIRKPTLSVVCAQPHHAGVFVAAEFRQRGSWAAHGQVTVTISAAHARRPVATLEASTGTTGTFHIDKVLVRTHNSPWRAGATYMWTTEIDGNSWVTARSGTVVLGGSC